jgi:hypothetical protein
MRSPLETVSSRFFVVDVAEVSASRSLTLGLRFNRLCRVEGRLNLDPRSAASGHAAPPAGDSSRRDPARHTHDAGPAVLTTLITLARTHGYALTVTAYVLNLVIVWAALRWASLVGRLLGEAGGRAITRVLRADAQDDYADIGALEVSAYTPQRGTFGKDSAVVNRRIRKDGITTIENIQLSIAKSAYNQAEFVTLFVRGSDGQWSVGVARFKRVR